MRQAGTLGRPHRVLGLCLRQALTHLVWALQTHPESQLQQEGQYPRKLSDRNAHAFAAAFAFLCAGGRCPRQAMPNGPVAGSPPNPVPACHTHVTAAVGPSQPPPCPRRHPLLAARPSQTPPVPLRRPLYSCCRPRGTPLLPPLLPPQGARWSSHSTQRLVLLPPPVPAGLGPQISLSIQQSRSAQPPRLIFLLHRRPGGRPRSCCLALLGQLSQPGPALLCGLAAAPAPAAAAPAALCARGGVNGATAGLACLVQLQQGAGESMRDVKQCARATHTQGLATHQDEHSNPPPCPAATGSEPAPGLTSTPPLPTPTCPLPPPHLTHPHPSPPPHPPAPTFHFSLASVTKTDSTGSTGLLGAVHFSAALLAFTQGGRTSMKMQVG